MKDRKSYGEIEKKKRKERIIRTERVFETK